MRFKGKGPNVLEQNVKRVPQGKDHIVEHNLVLFRSAHHIQHHVAFHLEDHHPVVIEDNIAGLLRRLLQETLLECLLVLQARVWIGAWVVVALRTLRDMWGRVILGEDAGRVVGGEDQDGIDGEEGHVGRHDCD